MGRCMDSVRWRFFLGGYDLEMLTIRDLLRKMAPDRVVDKGLTWKRARISEYKSEISEALAQGEVPVLIELDGKWPDPMADVRIVDHHGAAAGKDKPSSLRQVFDLLACPMSAWTRWMGLVEANDIGYLPAMKAMGATVDEMAEVRRLDRAAQGITEEEELLAARSIEERRLSFDGALTEVDLPHDRTATVTDRLDGALGGQGYKTLLVWSPGEVNVYGPGPLLQKLDQQFTGGWLGGSLPEYGYWGCLADDNEKTHIGRAVRSAFAAGEYLSH